MLSLAFSLGIVVSCLAHNTPGSDIYSGKKTGKSAYLTAVVSPGTVSASAGDTYFKSPMTGNRNATIPFIRRKSSVCIPNTLLVSLYERNLFYIHTTINAP